MRLQMLRKLKSGFSLFEILVALGIFLVIALMLFPTLYKVRKTTRGSVCLSNMRQIHTALSIYQSDNDGYYPLIGYAVTKNDKPYPVGWQESIGLATPNSTLNCPSVILPEILEKHSYRSLFTGYAINTNLVTIVSRKRKQFAGKNEVKIASPATTVQVFDGGSDINARPCPDTGPDKSLLPSGWDHDYCTDNTWSLTAQKGKRSDRKGGAERHRGGANYLFCDGHAKWYKPEQLSPARTNDGVHPGFAL